MKGRGYGNVWYRGRLSHWLRGLLVLAAGWGVLLCGQQVAEGYGATMEYRDAPVCQGGGRSGDGDEGELCVRREAGTVLDRRTGERCTSNGTSGGTTGGITTGGVTAGGGMNTAGGAIGGVTAGGVTTTGGGGGGGGMTCTTYYDLKVQRPGGTTWLGVGSETYDDARRGDHAEVRLWQGDVVELRVRGHIDSYAPSSQQTVFPWLALGCLILAGGAWALLNGRLSGLFAFPNFGLLFVAVGAGWLGDMALFGGHPMVWMFAIVWTGFAVFWTVGAWRDG
ncbi:MULTISPECIES: hypothetical protein [Streptomyces]|uniref:hypothetical protein n=1 Tax=Streptomyces TaxID=1883 RepID=UPI001E2B061E|nr:hypothetical protein [Streptomyces canarius]